MSAPDTFRDPWAPRQQILSVLDFWYPDAVDHTYGGYVAQKSARDGTVYDGRSRHLVATCRLVFNFSVGRLVGGPDWCRSAAEHGLRFLFTRHRDERGGFHWLLEGDDPVDRTHYCYGHAFALLAAATAAKAGVPGATERVAEAYEVLEREFFESDHDLYAAEVGPDWEDVSEYRGQNANMHACEAAIAAHEATGEGRYLDRAYTLADRMTRDLASETDGRIWEHYTAEWDHDFEYNRDDPRHTFRPWGYQPGHHAEWAKLLLALDRHREEGWLRDRAVELFDVAVDTAWDDARGGFAYSFDRDGNPVVEERYDWTVAEAVGASALLGARVDADYWDWYDRLWQFAREHFVNPKYGVWYARLTPDNELPPEERDVVVEPGYHPVSNAFEAMRALGAASASGVE